MKRTERKTDSLELRMIRQLRNEWIKLKSSSAILQIKGDICIIREKQLRKIPENFGIILNQFNIQVSFSGKIKKFPS